MPSHGPSKYSSVCWKSPQRDYPMGTRLCYSAWARFRKNSTPWISLLLGKTAFVFDQKNMVPAILHSRGWFGCKSNPRCLCCKPTRWAYSRLSWTFVTNRMLQYCVQSLCQSSRKNLHFLMAFLSNSSMKASYIFAWFRLLKSFLKEIYYGSVYRSTTPLLW